MVQPCSISTHSFSLDDRPIYVIYLILEHPIEDSFHHVNE